MNKLDQAIKFALQYLDILERALDFRYSDNGDLFIVTPISVQTLRKLKKRIDELFRDGSAGAICDSSAYSKVNVQTVGFGLIPHIDFDKFIKIGLLCGTRLVLWDLIGGRILRRIDANPERVTSLTISASNLLRLKSIVEAGGLVILPHPLTWSHEARYQLSQFTRTENVDTSHYGLVSALSVVNEIPLHPYTIFPDSSMVWPKHPAGLENHDYYPRESYVFHKVVDDIFEDSRFAYLKNASAADFFKVISGNASVAHQLLRVFSPPPGIISPQQIAAYSKSARDSLAEEIKKRNKHIITAQVGKTGAGLTFITALFTAINSATCLSTNPIGIAVMGLSAALFKFLSEVVKKEKQNIVVQAFIDISKANRRS